jgi:hypothetical protein
MLYYNHKEEIKEITKMYEYEIMNRDNDEITFIHGYSVADAFRRTKLDKDQWTVVYAEYVD